MKRRFMVLKMLLIQISNLKQQLDLCRPFQADILMNLEKWFEIELTYTSNALEGNTLTRSETALVLEKGITVGGKPLKDHLEATNHREALSYMKKLVSLPLLSLEDILKLNKLILKGIEDAHAGIIRTIPVRISGSNVILPNPLKVPDLLDEFIDWLWSSEDHPVQKAALAHFKLVSIHPFCDGNGRVARLLMNLILIQNGYPPIIIAPKNRLKYIKSIESAQLGGSLEEYLKLMSQLAINSLKMYLKALNNEPTEEKPNKKLIRIGELATRSNESVSTLRYWTKIGLIDVVDTTPSGYQLYEEEPTLERCKLIRQYQKQRFTLEEILEQLASS